MKRSLGQVIRERRTKRGITQDEMERLTGLDQAYLSRVERGAIKWPSAIVAGKIALALGTTVDELLRECERDGEAARIRPVARTLVLAGARL